MDHFKIIGLNKAISLSYVTYSHVLQGTQTYNDSQQ